MMEKDRIIECNKDKELIFNRSVHNCCGNMFLLDENNIFEISCVNYIGELEEQFYTICPNCGYMVMIDSEMLTDDIKEDVRIKSVIDPYLFRKNQLRSELIYLENISNQNSKKLVRKANSI